MIELYSSTTPNVLKVVMMLEEIGLPYRLVPVDVWKGEQFADEFMQLNPNAKVPVLVDPEGSDGRPCTVFESVAILIYLAEKSGRLLPVHGRARYDVIQWSLFQAANLGPANGQFNHFERYAGPGHDYALSRYTTELHRLYRVMEGRLSKAPWLGGEEFSIADLASLPWVMIQSRRLKDTFPFLDRDAPQHPAISDWVARCEARPAIQRALAVHATMKSGLANATPDDLDRIFGRGRYAYRDHA